MRLLWVENHAGFAHLAGRQFFAGHDLTVVPSLAQAREVLATGTFDAVLLDYDLDDGKGASLVEFLRQLPTVPAVVATSAHEDGNGFLLAAGADAACPKGGSRRSARFSPEWLRPGAVPNPYMASFVNRRTANGGRFLLLPRRHNRAAIDRFANGCRGLSGNGVSVSLHQTLIQGSAARARRIGRL